MYCITRRVIRSSVFFFLMIRRPPRSTLDRSSAASDVYKRQQLEVCVHGYENKINACFRGVGVWDGLVANSG